MNEVILIGRLTKDPLYSVNPATQLAMAKFNLAVNRPKGKDGKDNGADFISCTAFGKTAETINKYCQKGKQVAIKGRIQTGGYEKEGKKVFTTDVIVDNMEFTGSASENTTGNQASSTPPPAPIKSQEEVKTQQQTMGDFIPIGDEEIPF